MHAETMFKNWLAIGLAVNAILLVLFGNQSTVIGPYWLWLIAIPSLAWLIITAKFNTKKLRLGRAQAVRRVHR
jgi:hypothetical protein